LLVGLVAERDGLFAAAGARLSRLPLGPHLLLTAALLLVALVTAILNLDTSVFFLTPVLLHMARHRGLDETPFLYGAVFMSNAGSLFLPGSNLTNLIVLHHEPASGAAFLADMWPAATAAVVVTILFLLVAFRHALGTPVTETQDPPPARLGIGVVAIAVSTVLVLGLANPALPVLACGLAAVALERLPVRQVLHTVDPRVLGGLFVLAVAVGTLGHHVQVSLTGQVESAVAGAVSAVAINNLPAAMLLAANPPAHASALLLGLNLGPNLAVTGSLSAFLWLRVAHGLDARPSARRYTALGLVLVPLSLAASLLAASL
jgi:arsenical pump membrane protein